jgi:simple sugar transport system permease protein
VPAPVAVVVGLLAAAGVGLFNGLVTQLLRLPSFITTLGSLFLLHGITLKVSGNFRNRRRRTACSGSSWAPGSGPN